MTSPFSEKKLRRQLEKLDNESRVAFAAACCSRLIPNYRLFSSETGYGDVDSLISFVETLWLVAQGQSFSADYIARVSERCEKAVPDLEVFSSLYASIAQDACLAICNAVRYVLNKKVDRLVNVASYARDSVDLYVQEKNNMDPQDPRLEEKILRHPLMQKELLRQQRDLEDLGRDASAMSRMIDEFDAIKGGSAGGNLR